MNLNDVSISIYYYILNSPKRLDKIKQAKKIGDDDSDFLG